MKWQDAVSMENSDTSNNPTGNSSQAEIIQIDSPTIVSNPSRRIQYKSGKKRLEWSNSALDEYNRLEDKIRITIRNFASNLAQGKDASVVTDSDVRDARRRLLFGLEEDHPIWYTIGRLLSILLMTYGGIVFSQGDASEDSTKMLSGLLLIIAFLCIEEMLYHIKHKR
jgi:hypothetical protein